MQPDLPWNVAGIPPEAREAARAAARREGLSVGEWLTRKILRSLTAAAHELEEPSEHWRNPAASRVAAYRNVAESAAAATRDTEDMLARVSRSEDESQTAYRRIEDHLKSVARRLDAAERSQSENNRAVSKAASEINIAAREQAQAFDQLDSHVTALSERLSRVEQNASGSSLKDAVKALHQGLSRVADQVTATANQSATQIATLAQNVESLTGRLSQTRHDVETASRALKDHLVTVDERVRVIEKNETPSEALTRLRETLDDLSARVSAAEAQTGGSVVRLQESVGKLESRVQETGFDRRLQGIEHSLAGLKDRFDEEERDATDALRASLRELTQRLETAEKSHKQEVAELRAAVERAQAKAIPAAPPPQQPAAAPQAAGFDLPPFPQANVPPPFLSAEPAPPPFAQPALGQAGADTFTLPPPPFDTPPDLSAEQRFSGIHAFDGTNANGFDPAGLNGTGFVQPAQQSVTMAAESYISATRRLARAAAEAQQAAQATHGFAWSAGVSAGKEPGRHTRHYLIGGIAMILLVALVAGTMMFRNIALPPLETPAAPLIPPSLSGSGPAMKPAEPAPVAQPVQKPEGKASAQVPAAVPEKSAAPAHKPAPVKAVPTKAQAVPGHTTSTQIAQQAVPQQTPPQAVAVLSPFERLTANAKSGDAKAETVLGLKYVDGDGIALNEAEGANWLQRAAQQGEAVAQYRLGTLYERGRGVAADPKLAAAWYAAAAKLGNRKAMHNLAVAYAQGSGVVKNLTAAAEWFTKAANLGLRDSQFNLAVLYERGMGVPQSLTDAYKWYAVAAAQGDAESKARVAALTTQLGADERAAAQSSADSFKPKPLDRAANMAPTLAELSGG